ncbi:hypothetical protein R54767_02865 [Paraburkholderia gardini]|uniref:Uncharacterized protein n=1 Tax=Paraburkholderia gardini TaxID=2823469 RepID=A0ABM8U4N7_9BURK|nr:hypothetical protein R54767_02865 [Paraburkholderia gardini]
MSAQAPNFRMRPIQLKNPVVMFDGSKLPYQT